MPIPVVCGSCSAKLMAPDAAAGKKVKCKNCQSVIAVPEPVAEEESDFEFVDPATLAPPKPVAAKPVVAAVVPVKAKSKPAVIVEDEDNEEFDFGAAPKKSKAKVVADDDDEPKPKKKSKAVVALDDEDEDDAPRKSKKKAIVAEDDEDDEDDAPRKGKKSAKKKGNPLILVLGGVGALLAVGFLGAMVWYFAIREDKGGTAGTNSAPTNVGPESPIPPKDALAGWTKYDKPEFTAYFQDSLGKPAYKSNPIDGANFKIDKDDTKGLAKAFRSLEITAVPMPAEVFAAIDTNAEKYYENTIKQITKSGKVKELDRKNVTVDGRAGKEVRLEDSDRVCKGYIRMAFAHRRFYLLSVQAPTWIEADEMARIFYSTVKLIAGIVDAEPLQTKSNQLTKDEAMQAAKIFAGLSDTDVIVTDLIGPMAVSQTGIYSNPESGGTWGYYLSYTYLSKDNGSRQKRNFQLVYLGREYAPDGPPKWYGSIAIEKRIRVIEGDEWLKKNPIPGTVSPVKQ